MLSPDQAFTRILHRFPQAQAAVATRRNWIVNQLADCLASHRFVVYGRGKSTELNPDFQFVTSPDLYANGMNPSPNPFAPSEDTVTIRRANYTNRFAARSQKIINVFTVNQRKFWETLGWSALSAGSTLTTELAKDWRIISPILALCIVLKDFKGVATHEFDEYEAHVLYTLYDLSFVSDQICFKPSQINKHYQRLFGKRLVKSVLEQILFELTKLHTLTRQESHYRLNETITLEF